MDDVQALVVPAKPILEVNPESVVVPAVPLVADVSDSRIGSDAFYRGHRDLPPAGPAV
jgi:hypothetical protein